MTIGRTRYVVAAAFLALLCTLFCGCLSVGRVPLPEHEAYSDDGVCTNRTWSVPLHDIMRGDGFNWRVYPTVRMRCRVTAYVFSPIDRTKRGEDLYRERNKRWLAIPLALVWATAPLDAAVDTLFAPFDIWRTSKSDGDCPVKWDSAESGPCGVEINPCKGIEQGGGFVVY